MYPLCNRQNQRYVKTCYAAQHATQTAWKAALIPPPWWP